MTLIEELKNQDQTLEAMGVMDWKLKEEIKNLEKIKSIFKRIKDMEYYEKL